jgi:hypothetical protein
MRKVLLFVLLSCSTVYAQDRRFTAGYLAGAGYSFNYGAWIGYKKIGIEYVQGTANPQLVAEPTDYRNIGINYHITDKFFIGGGVQRVYDSSITNLPYASFGIDHNFGNNDLYVVRGEVITGGQGYTTLNLGLGLNF